jgi:hypothetical protein
MQTVNTAELLDGPVDEILYRLRIGEVELDGNCVSAGLGDLLGGGGGGGAGDVDVADSYAGALVGEASGGGRADFRWLLRRSGMFCPSGRASGVTQTYPTPISTETWVAVTNLD